MLATYAPYLGLAAGLTQLIGYFIYYRLVVRKEGKEAEPLTWFMFAYGTAILTILEFDSMVSEATRVWTWLHVGEVLLLPLVCSSGAIFVAYTIWRTHYNATKRRWLKEWTVNWKTVNGFAFGVDLILTILYTSLWVIATFFVVSDWWYEALVLAFLAASNATTFPNFAPILQKAWEKPEEEDARPWFIWGAAYSFLLFPTYNFASNDVVWPTTWRPSDWELSFWTLLALMSYPAINAVMHSLMGVIAARPARKAKGEVMNPAE
ncbi:MAG: hypothetical protein RLZZ360_5 [Candidatus Parcubacteria bacterium]|jgi:hypothetical protein